MNIDYSQIFSFSIFIAGIIALVRFQKINSSYYPFIFVIWLAGINELITDYLLSHGHYNIINNNIYNLAESLLLLWLFKNLGVIKNKSYFAAGLVALVCIWIFNNFIYYSFGSNFNSHFNITYAFVLVVLSINGINNLLFREKVLLKNPAFLIFIGIIIFFTYQILVEAFWLYGSNTNKEFSVKVYDILSWINLLCNLIYALAILWIQKKQAFTLRF
jgi:hypothetical protein